MTDYDKDAVRAAISAERLARYVAQCNGCQDAALDLYSLNMALCEAFYTPLQAVEVCLRNGLHDAMRAEYATHWMTNGGPPLDADAAEKISAAIESRQQSGKAIAPPDIVAEIGFSFWVGLLGPRYDATLWRSTLHKTFRGKPKGFSRKVCHGRFNAIRRFRNRVAHHEPILDRDPMKMHTELIEAIGWLSPDKAQWTSERSRAPLVFAEVEALLAQHAAAAVIAPETVQMILGEAIENDAPNFPLA